MTQIRNQTYYASLCKRRSGDHAVTDSTEYRHVRRSPKQNIDDIQCWARCEPPRLLSATIVFGRVIRSKCPLIVRCPAAMPSIKDFSRFRTHLSFTTSTFHPIAAIIAKTSSTGADSCFLTFITSTMDIVAIGFAIDCTESFIRFTAT